MDETFEHTVIGSDTVQTTTTTEMGYLLLENCHVLITGSMNHLPHQIWIPVELCGRFTNTPSDDRETVPTTRISDHNDKLCHSCNLILHYTDNREEPALTLNICRQYPFNGTVQDLFCNECTNEDEKRKKRDDSSLLVGLIVACSDHVRPLQCQVLLRSDGSTSLYLTLDFPYLHVPHQGRRSILPPMLKHRVTQSTKQLPPPLQLLLQVICSDWKRLEKIKDQLQNKDTCIKSRKFFPSCLSLGEVYTSIQESNTINSYNQSKPQRQVEYGLLMSLPIELLAGKVGAFLDSLSLSALRCCSTYFEKSFSHIVPGLKLQLYLHQIQSLVWMRRRESSLIRTESDCFRNIEDTFSLDGDIHRAVTGGGSVRLESSSKSITDNESKSFIVHLNSCTGYEIDQDCRILSREVARGGIQADDPGLGKTITVLSLFLQTFGLRGSSTSNVSSDKVQVVQSENEHNTGITDDEAIFRSYWSDHIVRDFRRLYLTKLLNDYCKVAIGANRLNWKLIRQAIDADEFGCDFSKFELATKNLILENSADESASRLDTFTVLVTDFQNTQLRSARKAFSNAQSKPNSRVAALIDAKEKEKLFKALIQSFGTLLVVPSVLVEHWKTQIEQHVDFRFCTDKHPLIFEYGKRDSEMTVDRVTILCDLHKTHTPVVFIDQTGTRPLPPAEFLAKFLIVITTTQRFMHEWKGGSLQSFMKEKDSNKRELYHDNLQHTTGPEKPCELLRVFWQRMVVDEGHSMGNDDRNATIQFASWINAKCRWALTGTPTKQNSPKISQFRGLMNFLQHNFFTARLNGDTFWRRNLVNCWRDGHLVSFFRLRSLLGFLMKRHTKLDIAELPPPDFVKSIIAMSFSEATTYNTVVCGIQNNILMTSLQGKTSGFQDSLLHKSQSRNARLALQNIRRVCSGFSLRVVPSLEDRFYRQTFDMARQFKLSEKAMKSIQDFLFRAENEELSRCSFCGLYLSTLILMSCCGGQICTECMDSSTRTCHLCSTVFDVDDLQKFQPGFVLNWKEEAPSSLRAFTNPSASAVDNHSDIPNEAEPELGPLIRPPREHRKKRRLGDGHICEFDRYTVDGKCIHCLEEHDACNFLNSQSRCALCYRMSEECPKEDSKSFYLINRLLTLHGSQLSLAYSSKITTTFGVVRPLKVIVFSQFRAALNSTGHRLLRRFGPACVAEFFGRHRKKELHKFTYDRDCFCLLLTKDGSEGLDLSFVTHIFFFEEIFDKSLERQVVARAWRMGAQGSVHCDTLLAGNSVEETMSNLATNDEDEWKTVHMVSSRDQQLLKTLLLSLRFVTDHHHFAWGNETDINHSKVIFSDLPASRKRQIFSTKPSLEAFPVKTKKVRFTVDLPS